MAKALGYRDTSDALKKHVDFEDKLTRQIADSGQRRKVFLINESGLYSLILSSKLPQAKAFKRWVTSEVLPQIRKTGGYIPTRDAEGRQLSKELTGLGLAEDRHFLYYSLHGQQKARTYLVWTPAGVRFLNERFLASDSTAPKIIQLNFFV